MQNPSDTSIADNQTPEKLVSLRKPKFPLSAEHQCDRQGFVCPCSGEWDSIEDFDLGHRLPELERHALVDGAAIADELFQAKHDEFGSLFGRRVVGQFGDMELFAHGHSHRRPSF